MFYLFKNIILDFKIVCVNPKQSIAMTLLLNWRNNLFRFINFKVLTDYSVTDSIPMLIVLEKLLVIIFGIDKILQNNSYKISRIEFSTRKRII